MRVLLCLLVLPLSACHRGAQSLAPASAVRAMSVDDRFVYWNDGSGVVRRAPKSGGDPEVVETGVGASSSASSATGGGWIVEASQPWEPWGNLPQAVQPPPAVGLWARLRSWIPDLSAPQPPASSHIAISSLTAKPVSGGAVTPLASVDGRVDALAVNDAGVVWSQDGGRRMVLDPSKPCYTDSCIDQMVVVEGATGIESLPWGATAKVVVAGVDSPALAIDPDWIYFFDSAKGEIERVRR